MRGRTLCESSALFTSRIGHGTHSISHRKWQSPLKIILSWQMSGCWLLFSDIERWERLRITAGLNVWEEEHTIAMSFGNISTVFLLSEKLTCVFISSSSHWKQNMDIRSFNNQTTFLKTRKKLQHVMHVNTHTQKSCVWKLETLSISIFHVPFKKSWEKFLRKLKQVKLIAIKQHYSSGNPSWCPKIFVPKRPM